MLQAALSEREDRRAAARALEVSAQGARREHLTELASLRMEVRYYARFVLFCTVLNLSLYCFYTVLCCSILFLCCFVLLYTVFVLSLC